MTVEGNGRKFPGLFRGSRDAGRGTDVPGSSVAVHPSLDRQPSRAAEPGSRDPVAEALGSQITSLGRGLVRQPGEVATVNFPYDIANAHRKRDGVVLPGADYYSTDSADSHPLADKINKDANVHYIGGTLEDRAAFVAHRAGAFLADPENVEKQLVMVDLTGGFETFRAGIEAAERGENVAVAEATLPAILAHSTPDQARQILASSAYAHFARNPGGEQHTTAKFSYIIQTVTDVINNERRGRQQGPITLNPDQLSTGISVLIGHEILENKTLEALISGDKTLEEIEAELPLTLTQIAALKDKWIPKKRAAHESVAVDLLAYLMIADNDSSSDPVRLTPTGEQVDLEKGQNPRVMIWILRNTGSHPAEQGNDVVTGFLTVKAGDNTTDQRPGRFIVAGAGGMNGDDGYLLPMFCERHRVGLDTTRDYLPPSEGYRYGQLTGRLAFGYMGDLLASPHHSNSLGRNQRWGLSGTSSSVNESHTEGESTSTSTTEGNSHSTSMSGGIFGFMGSAMGLGGMLSESITDGQERSETKSTERNSSNSTGRDSGVQEGLVDTAFQAEHKLRRVQPGEMRVIGRGDGDPTEIVSLNPYAYPQLTSEGQEGMSERNVAISRRARRAEDRARRAAALRSGPKVRHSPAITDLPAGSDE